MTEFGPARSRSDLQRNGIDCKGNACRREHAGIQTRSGSARLVWERRPVCGKEGGGDQDSVRGCNVTRALIIGDPFPQRHPLGILTTNQLEFRPVNVTLCPLYLKMNTASMGGSRIYPKGGRPVMDWCLNAIGQFILNGKTPPQEWARAPAPTPWIRAWLLTPRSATDRSLPGSATE